MARLLARNQRAQALHGRTTTTLARQVVACMRGTEAETLAKTVQVRSALPDGVSMMHPSHDSYIAQSAVP